MSLHMDEKSSYRTEVVRWKRPSNSSRSVFKGSSNFLNCSDMIICREKTLSEEHTNRRNQNSVCVAVSTYDDVLQQDFKDKLNSTDVGEPIALLVHKHTIVAHFIPKQ